MFLCRRLHSQLRLSRTSHSVLVSRTKYSNVTRNSNTTAQLRLLDVSSSAEGTTGGLSDCTRDACTNLDETTDKTQVETQVETQPRSPALIPEVLTGGPLPRKRFPAGPNAALIEQAIASGNIDLLEDVARDVLQCHGSNTVKNSRIQDIRRLLEVDVIRILPLSTTTALLSSVTTSSLRLSDDAIYRLLLRVYKERVEATHPLLHHLHQHILQQLQESKSARPHSVSYSPPNIVRSAFRLIATLLPDRQEEIIDIFEILIDKGHIPSRALVDSSSSQTFAQIVGISLVKASLYWNWTPLVGFVLSRLLHSTHHPDSFTLKHATDIIYNLLISPSTSDLRCCLSLIRLLHSCAPVPDVLVRQFYDCAVGLNAITLAEEMYNFSRDPVLLAGHNYPPPQGRALSWLMLHLARKSKKVYLARTLASDVAQGHLPIPIDTRAQFISAAAEMGFATSARILWERYAAGKDSNIIHCAPSLMLRMVSLFTKLARSMESKLRNLEEDAMEVAEVAAKLSDLRSFVDQIITKYREHHEPWKDADHRILTSYARACFIVGKSTEGFDTFKILLDRRELPDLYDVNVALTAISERDLKAAARMVEKMIEHSMPPDAVSIGTVLHQSLAQKSTRVAEDMIKHAMALDSTFSDEKAFWTLTRAVTEPRGDEDREARVFKLQRALKLVRRFINRGGLPSVQLGNYLVSLAIEARDAHLAFDFWSVLLKESGLWDDNQQRQQRRAIAQLTLALNRRGEIGGTESRRIISQLQKRER